MLLKHAVLACALPLCLLVLPGRALACEAADIQAVVNHMGYWADASDQKDMLDALHCLAEHGPSAAKLLIAELHPVAETEISGEEEDKYPKTMHVIWCWRGLRYITGLDFMAGSADAIRKQKLDKAREYWLLLDSGDSVRIYSTWMSRDVVFIAPEDVQQAVIDKWKRWYAADGAGFQYKTQTNFVDWYY